MEYPSICCLSEHHLTDDTIRNYSFLPGYKLVSYFCRSNHKCGGVVIYAKNFLDIKNMEMHDPTECLFEYCLGVLNMGSSKYAIICVYRPPNTNFNVFYDKLHLLLFDIHKKYAFIVICGDFNLNFLSHDPNVKKLLSLFQSFGVRHHVKEFTRITETSSTCIDNIFSSITNVTDCRVHHTNFSDHSAQLLKFETKYFNNNVIKYDKRLFTEENKIRFKELLKTEDWSPFTTNNYSCKSLNINYSSFFEVIKHNFEICFPRKKFSVLNNESKNLGGNAWYDDELRKMSTDLKDLNYIALSFKCQALYKYYKEKQKKYRLAINQKKKNFYSTKIINSNNKSKTVWDLIRNETTRTIDSHGPISLLGQNDEIITNPRKIAEMFVEKFTLTSTDFIHDANFSTDCLLSSSFFLYPTSDSEVCDIILGLSPKHSYGFDEISPAILKTIPEEISPPLAAVVNNCIEEGSFPDELKRAKLIPIFKKGSKTDINNYRPVSLLPVLSKVFERLIYKRLYEFLKRNKIFSNCQYGFLPGKSTENAIFESLSVIVNCLDKGESLVGIYFDLSKAFETLNHEVLLHKLWCYGIRGKTHDLFRSYLGNRFHRVNIVYQKNGVSESVVSSWKEVTCGVPQGSILGPLLFIMYVNDLPLHLTCPIFQFADDTSSLIVSKSLSLISSLGCQILDQMKKWCSLNSLMLNEKKTSLVQFKGCSNESVLVKSQKSIPLSSEIKFLGIIIDHNLKFEKQIDHVIKKLNKACFAIRTIRETVDISVIRIYYFAYVQSVLSYGIIFWGSSQHAHKVFIAQKRIIRCIMGVQPSHSCKPLFIQLGILPVPSLYISHLAKYVRKNFHQFKKNIDCHQGDIATRCANNLRIPLHNTAAFERGPEYRAIKAYNALPAHIRNECSDMKFKNHLRDFLITRCFYSFEEFVGNLNV